MTDIEQKALALLNAVEVDRVLFQRTQSINREYTGDEALCRAIQQHEAFRQEVSAAAATVLKHYPPNSYAESLLSPFIIAKPDPLVEAIHEVDTGPIWDGTQDYANKVRAAIEKRGGKIVWGEKQ